MVAVLQIDGLHHHFWSPEHFEEKRAGGALLALLHAEDGYSYASPPAAVFFFMFHLCKTST